ncbi:MAG TPA: YCF48-related protein [Reyranella sp.]|nr:YCF48-related protein [Reyranella sp.]
MADTSNIYAGVAGYFGRPDHPGKVGVFQRAAKGGDWKHVLGTVQAFTVFVKPDNPEMVFAGTNDGVWRSTDHGNTFRKTAFPDQREVWCFMVDSRNPKRMLAGASPLDVYASDDEGASWSKLSTPKMPEHCKGPFASRVMRLAQHPTRPDEIFAALEINGVMRSTDGGKSWSDCSDGLLKLAELPHLKSQIVSNTTAEGMLDGHAISINPAQPDAAIAALRMGLFRTTDKGKTWQDMEVGRFSPTTYGRDIRVSASEPNTMYAALSVAASSHDGGLYRSQDGGQSWQRFDKVQVHGTIMSIGLHQRDPGQVYIGARYDGEVFGTQDGGKSWQAMPLPGEVQHIYAVACG